MKITKRQLKRIIKEEKRKLLREVTPSEREEALRLNAIDVGTGGIDYEARDKKALSDVYEILQDLEHELMIMGGDTKGYRPRLDSPPLTHEQKYAMETANEMREQILKAMDLLESMGAIG